MEKTGNVWYDIQHVIASQRARWRGNPPAERYQPTDSEPLPLSKLGEGASAEAGVVGKLQYFEPLDE